MHPPRLAGETELPRLPERCATCGGSVLANGSAARVIRTETVLDWNDGRPRVGRPPLHASTGLADTGPVVGYSDLAVRLRRARDLIDRQFAADDLDVARVAATAGLSKWHFVRVFATQYGLTPGAYLSRRRIERAQDLLRFANLTVTEVCFAVGFSSLGSFSSAFTARVGQTPSAYQRHWRRRGSPRIPGCVLLMWGLQPTAATQEKPLSGGQQ